MDKSPQSCKIYEEAFILVVKFMKGLLSTISFLDEGAYVLHCTINISERLSLSIYCYSLLVHTIAGTDDSDDVENCNHNSIMEFHKQLVCLTGKTAWY